MQFEAAGSGPNSLPNNFIIRTTPFSPARAAIAALRLLLSRSSVHREITSAIAAAQATLT